MTSRDPAVRTDEARRAPRLAGHESPLIPVDPTPVELGRRIKLLRVSRGLTLKHIEQRGGISATHVSEIERGKASPTVGALARVARALGVRPATLVEPCVRPEMSRLHPGERASRRVVCGNATVETLVEPALSTHLRGELMTLPLSPSPALVHRHEGEEWVSVLSGLVEIRIGEETYVLREGDSLHFRAHHPHSYSNLASSPAVLLAVGHPRSAF